MHPIAQVSAERLDEVCGEEPGFLCRRTLELTDSDTVAEIAGIASGAPLRILLIVLLAGITVLASRRVIKLGLRRMAGGQMRRRLSAARGKAPQSLFETREHATVRSAQRVEALALVLASAATFAIWLIAVMLILDEVGVSLAPLLAGAGVIGIALGFGAQSLVKDFLTGIFILIEDQFAVGDVIDLDSGVDGGMEGVVEAVSLRTTRMRSVDGTVWHVPNGEIRSVGNKSQHWSRALLDIEVDYNTDLDLAQAVIKRAADEVQQEDSDILDEPKVWGVEALGASGIAIRLVVKTRPSEQWRISRVLRQRIKQAFDAEGIEIPFPQQTIHYRPEPGAAPPTEPPL